MDEKTSGYEDSYGKSVLSRYISSENFTSSAVSGVPSWNFALSTMCIVQVTPSSATDQSVANSGT